MRRRILAACACVVASMFLCIASAPANCELRTGSRVALYGSFGDPDVFVWESRFRLGSYQTGSFDIDQSLLPHARLASPGTRALVLACVPRYIHPKYRSTLDDAVFIKLLGGKYRGQTGWVMASDLRVMLGRL
jgi:hypothetical protein